MDVFQSVLPSQLQQYLGNTSSTTFAAIAVTTVVGVAGLVYFLTQNGGNKENDANQKKEDEKEPIEPRDFTLEQLRKFDGKEDPAIYISLYNDVFDVSAATNYYGEGAGYHCFAGREASRAMAKLSFEEAELANTRLDDLTHFEKGILDDWYNKFKHFRCYPIVGRVSVPPTNLQLTKEQLKAFTGAPCTAVPEGRVDAPIYVSINRKILDVSYGGKEMYGEGSGYALFAGVDASKALARMSFEPHLLNDTDLSDLTPEERKVLDDWDTRLCGKYPCVGTLVD